VALEMNRFGEYNLLSLEKFLSPEDRILILGAGGWFGRTMLHMLGSSLPVLAISSTPRKGHECWSMSKIEQFKPTFVANFAFLTRDKLLHYKRDRYVSLNLQLIDRMKYAAQLKTVRTLVTVSSGAAQDNLAQDGVQSREIYGALKRIEERTALECRDSVRSVVILRAYSVSGPYVRNLQQYAFSSFLEQGIKTGEIKINSTFPVYRRYVSVGDLLSVGVIQARAGFSGVIESGGDLIEIQDLAQLVGKHLKVPVIERKTIDSSQSDSYHSDNSSWEQSIRDTRIRPLTLLQQIDATARFIQREGYESAHATS